MVIIATVLKGNNLITKYLKIFALHQICTLLLHFLGQRFQIMGASQCFDPKRLQVFTISFFGFLVFNTVREGFRSRSSQNPGILGSNPCQDFFGGFVEVSQKPYSGITQSK